MSNTTQRILSGIVLVLILLAFVSVGQNGILVFVLIAGVLFVDEFLVNFLDSPRPHFSYVLSQLSFSGGFIFFNYLDRTGEYFRVLNQLAVLFHIVLLIYLFVEKMDSKKFLGAFKSVSYLSGVIFLVPFMSLAQIIHSNHWILLVLLLITFNVSVDTGAWFFGKKFGRKKLWPAISPKKTINGAVGGSLFAVGIASLISVYAFDKISFGIVIAFLLLSILAQLGDLIESKMKRQVGIKDSSNLIPGHGGIYDRLDSLLFIAPFFVVTANLFY